MDNEFRQKPWHQIYEMSYQILDGVIQKIKGQENLIHPISYLIKPNTHN